MTQSAVTDNLLIRDCAKVKADSKKDDFPYRYLDLIVVVFLSKSTTPLSADTPLFFGFTYLMR